MTHVDPDLRRAYGAAYRTAHRDAIKAWQAARYIAHRDAIKAARRAHYTAHRDQIRAALDSRREELRATGILYDQAHREERAAYRAAHQEDRHRAGVWYRFNLTPEAFDALLAAQGGVCADCHGPETRTWKGRVRALSVDHDHSCCPSRRSCGRCVRGIVCGRCNDRRRARDRRDLLNSRLIAA